MVSPQFEISVVGEVDPEDLKISDGVTITVSAGVTRVTGAMDQAALHGVLRRIEALELDLIEVRRLRPLRHPDD